MGDPLSLPVGPAAVKQVNQVIGDEDMGGDAQSTGPLCILDPIWLGTQGMGQVEPGPRQVPMQMEVFKGQPKDDQAECGHPGREDPANAREKLKGDGHQSGIDQDGEDTCGDADQDVADSLLPSGIEGQPITAQDIPNQENGIGIAEELGISRYQFTAVAEYPAGPGLGPPEKLQGQHPEQHHKKGLERTENLVFRDLFGYDLRFEQNEEGHEGDEYEEAER